MFEAVKNYLALANGVTEVTRQRAVAAARALVSSGEATAEQVTSLADDLLTTSRNNRDSVLALVRYEIDRALMRLGLATSEEISALAQRVTVLESSLRAARPDRSGDAAPSAPAGLPARPTKRATKTARKAPAKRSPAKRGPAKRVAGAPAAGGASAASPRGSQPDESSPAKASPRAQKRPATKATKTTKATNAAKATKRARPAAGGGTGAAEAQS
jgi:polyhydroxyalkanoate synthesis regulator phasin